MMTLKQVTINKYKCIETEQSFEVDPNVTVLVGKNESGKTAILEAITKSNDYHGEQFDVTHDYPRKWVTKFKRRQEDVRVIRCTYTLSKLHLQQIQEDVGPQTFSATEITHSRSYRNLHDVHVAFDVSISGFFDYKLGQHTFDKAFEDETRNVASRQDFDNLREKYQSESQREFLDRIKIYFANGQGLEASLHEYVVSKWIEPYLPKLLFYNHYYELPSEVNVRQVENGQLESNKLKTVKALFELALIDTKELLQNQDYETYKSQLEATSNEITLELFEYWKTNTNLQVQFDIERQASNNYQDPILKIRVYNNKYLMSLPLGSRSRGFNWFFSFLVWFSRIQEEKDNQYILLLDEPGLNLHASAQADLMRFIEKLAEDYQLIYTTHSPFMIDSDKLHRVRTVLETDSGTKISESIQEKDPDTLFPLQAALGYTLAQNLFITKNNLLIEGPSDLVYLQVLSSILEETNRTALREDITLVPVGGLDKVATFISLLRGQELNIVCLLDTFTDQKGKARVGDLVKQKIIRGKNIRFFDEFAGNGGNKADLEDLFNKDEYLKLFNQSFDKYPNNINLTDLNNSEKRIVQQIQKHLGEPFNHYQPASELAKQGVDAEYFSDETLNRFEKMFEEINKLFPSNN